jgi:hypothetical protein
MESSLFSGRDRGRTQLHVLGNGVVASFCTLPWPTKIGRRRGAKGIVAQLGEAHTTLLPLLACLQGAQSCSSIDIDRR